MTPITLITGASGGIGEELAVCAAKAGRKLVLVARSEEQLSRVASRIEKNGRPRPDIFAFDLSLPDAGARVAEFLKSTSLQIAEVVNNAGWGLVGPVATLPFEDQLNIVDLNIRALTDLTIRFLPDIIAARGGVLNVASTAAFQPGPNMAIYYASKSYALSFTEALAWELRGRVRVTALCPGPVPTGFQKRSNMGKTRISKLPGMPPARVAEIGWRGFERGKRVVIPGFINKLTAFFGPRVPRKPVLAVAGYLASHRRDI
jgi:short-subunit dehydrogenase